MVSTTAENRLNNSRFQFGRFRRIVNWLVPLWLLVLIGGTTYYGVRNFDQIVASLQAVSIVRVILSAVLLTIARLLMPFIARHAVRLFDWNPPYPLIMRQFAITDIGKYAPGSVWHMVGRVALYRTAGLTLIQGSRALFMEIFWIVLSAAAFGLILLAPLEPRLTIIAASATVVCWIAVIYVSYRLHGVEQSALATVRNLGWQIVIWSLAGASFAILLPGASWLTMVFAAGAFNLGWSAGFVGPSPGGLGIREFVMVGVLTYASTVTREDLIVLVGLHRMLWVMSEILLALLVSVMPGETVAMSAPEQPDEQS